MATEFPPPSPKFIRARHQGGSQKPKAIVLHGTVSSDDRGTARNIALWWNGPTSPVSSCHYVVDPGEVVQCVGDHSIAYHCGYNTGSLGVEFCDEQTGPATRWRDKDSLAILRRAATLVAQLCLAYDIKPVRPSIANLKAKGPHGIYGHNDSRLAFGNTTHTDPRDFPWRKFMRMVRAEIRRLRRLARVEELTLIAANFDFNKADKGYGPRIRRLIARGRPAVMGRVEVTKGAMGTRLTPVNLAVGRIRRIGRVALGKVGAHRHAARGAVMLNGREIRLFTLHALHRRTVGWRAQAAYFAAAARHTRSLNKRGISWGVMCDGNTSPEALAKLLGGKVAAKTDVMAVIVSEDTEVVDSGATKIGIHIGATGHGEAYATIV